MPSLSHTLYAWPLLLCLLLPVGAVCQEETPRILELVRQADELTLQQRYADALGLLEQAYNSVGGSTDSVTGRNVLNSLANLHYNTGRLEQAERYYRELIAFDRTGGDRMALSVSLYNIGHAVASAQRFAEAEAYLQESLTISQELDDLSGQAYTWKALGVNALATGSLAVARTNLLQAEAEFIRLGDDRQRASVQRHLGDLALESDAAEEALAYYVAAIPVLVQEGASDALQRGYRGLSRAYEALGDYEQALLAQRIYTGLLQEGLTEQGRDLTQRLQVEMDTRRYVDDNARLQAISLEQQQALDQNAQVLRLQYLVLMLAAALLALTGLMLRRSRKMADRLYQMANTDELTGLLNRRAIMENGARQWQRTVHEGKPFSVLLLDMDDFKIVNDTFGHAAGDAVLRQLALILRTSFRITDAAGRIGGEEFLLIAADSDAEEAQRLAERIRTRVANTRVPEIGDHALTISIGIASRRQESDLEQLIQHADHSLYRAKAEGRDRAVLFRVADAARSLPLATEQLCLR